MRKVSTRGDALMGTCHGLHLPSFYKELDYFMHSENLTGQVIIESGRLVVCLLVPNFYQDEHLTKKHI